MVNIVSIFQPQVCWQRRLKANMLSLVTNDIGLLSRMDEAWILVNPATSNELKFQKTKEVIGYLST